MAKFPTKSLPLLGIVLLLSVVGFFLLKSEREKTEETVIEESIPEEGMIIKNFNVTPIVPDKDIKWKLSAGKAYPIENSDEKFLIEKISGKFQSEDGLSFDLTGDSGEYDRSKNEILLSGNITGKGSNGFTVYADQLTVYMNENLIKSDKDVTVVGPSLKITGKGLFIDLKDKTLKILTDVKSIFDKESLNL